MKNSTLVIILGLLVIFTSCKDTATPTEKKESVEAQEEKTHVNTFNDEPRPSAYTFSGEPLFPVEESASSISKKDSALNVAKNNYRQDQSLENTIWYGRRMAYRGYYYPAIQLYTEGLKQYPESPELYRHRGHRYISTRELMKAIQDLEKAATLVKGRRTEIEPDGIPNRLNKPLSSLQFNIYYHLGLAYYLQANYAKAEEAYATCMKYSTNPDLLVATTDWLYLIKNRLGKKEEGTSLIDKVKSNMEMVENDSYFQRIQMYKGQVNPESLLNLDNDVVDKLDLVTQGYGVANYYLVNGDQNKFVEILEKIIETNYWAAFGYIAAEADLKRVREGTFNRG